MKRIMNGLNKKGIENHVQTVLRICANVYYSYTYIIYIWDSKSDWILNSDGNTKVRCSSPNFDGVTRQSPIVTENDDRA